MNRHVEIIWNNEPLVIRSFIEQIINAWEDFAYGYDIDASDEICNIFDELDIHYNIIKEDI